jgi:hypothetical protein
MFAKHSSMGIVRDGSDVAHLGNVIKKNKLL